MSNLRQAAQQALEALECLYNDTEIIVTLNQHRAMKAAITALRAALAEPEQEPVAWLITDEKINSLQVASIQRLIDRAKHAHHTDVLLRINGTNERYEADWLKHLTRTAHTPRKPQTTHWEGCEAVHPECRKPGIGEQHDQR